MTSVPKCDIVTFLLLSRSTSMSKSKKKKNAKIFHFTQDETIVVTQVSRKADGQHSIVESKTMVPHSGTTKSPITRQDADDQTGVAADVPVKRRYKSSVRFWLCYFIVIFFCALCGNHFFTFHAYFQQFFSGRPARCLDLISEHFSCGAPSARWPSR